MSAKFDLFVEKALKRLGRILFVIMCLGGLLLGLGSLAMFVDEASFPLVALPTFLVALAAYYGARNVGYRRPSFALVCGVVFAMFVATNFFLGGVAAFLFGHYFVGLFGLLFTGAVAIGFVNDDGFLTRLRANSPYRKPIAFGFRRAAL